MAKQTSKTTAPETPAAETENQTGGEPGREDLIRSAMRAIDRDNTALFTSSGKPKVEELVIMTGLIAGISAQERDALWVEVEAGRAADEEQAATTQAPEPTAARRPAKLSGQPDRAEVAAFVGVPEDQVFAFKIHPDRAVIVTVAGQRQIREL